MTRQDQLFSMNGATLIQLADKLGVKAACNKTRTQLKEKKENVVNRILEAEKKIADAKAEKQIEKAVEVKVEEAIASDGIEYTQVMKEIQQDAAKAVEAVKTKKAKTQPKTSVKPQATKKADEVDVKKKMSAIQSRKIEMLDILESLDVSFKTYDKIQNRILIKQNKKTLFLMTINRNGITYQCRENDVPESIDFHLISGYHLSAVIKTSNEDYMEVFNKLIVTTQNTQKEEK